MKRLFSLSAICLCVCAIALIASVSADDPVNEEPGDDPTTDTIINKKCTLPDSECKSRGTIPSQGAIGECGVGNPRTCGFGIAPVTRCECQEWFESTPTNTICYCKAIM
ncbi:hypothetical protein Spb1_39260 [Planctopirus ephydatiae]|uniref:Uncharacterized protein n=1 Tax=Planctopirus ephydatiae TaxID=2528019 RepID=A0A518GTT2_9PLAN|nr:hypothetical protein Spb1_39260 [Planctopirus ephydatiae]